MKALTCDPCLSGRHRGCMGLNGCACTVCAARPRPKAAAARAPRKAAAPRTPKPEVRPSREVHVLPTEGWSPPEGFDPTPKRGVGYGRPSTRIHMVVSSMRYEAECARLARIIHG